MGGSSGGGTSGKVEYPPHITEKHQTWLNIIGDPIASNPTSPLSVYGSPGSAPSATALTETAAMTAITALETRLGARETAIAALDIDVLLDGDLLGDVHDLVIALANALTSPTIPDENILPAGITNLANRLTALGSWSFNDTDISTGVGALTTRLGALDSWTHSDVDIQNGISAMNTRLGNLNALDDLEGVVDLETLVYPRYEAGMRDINAVNSSAFVLGRSVMEATYQAKMQEIKHGMIGEAENTRATLHSMRGQLSADVAKSKQQFIDNIETARAGLHQARGQIQAEAARAAQQFINEVEQLRSAALQARSQIQNAVELARFDGAFKFHDLILGVLKLMGELGRLRGMEEAKLRFEAKRVVEEMLLKTEAMRDALLAKNLELRRMRVVSEFELAGFKADLSIKHARWAMDNWQYFGNLMAAPGGGHGMAGDKMPSKMTSALSGGLSGAAAGAQLSGGNPWGALAGGVIGAGASLMQ